MTGLALVHIVWLLLLPIGIVVTIRGCVRRRRLAEAAGIALVALSIPGVGFCTEMWPFDFLLPRSEVRVPAVAGTYVVTLVQKPGIDFYDSFFEIRRADGKVTRVMIDADDNKWWRPQVVARGTRSYFVRGTGGITPETSFVDAADGTLFAGHYGDVYNLGNLSFDEPWGG
jgi:hypothetical protein